MEKYMDKVIFALCILVYATAVGFWVSRTKEFLVETPTVYQKLYTSACVLIYIVSFVCLTSAMKDDATITFRDMNGDPISFGGVAGYLFFWFVFSVLNGGILTILLFIPHIAIAFTLSCKNTNFSWNNLPNWLDTEMWPSLYVTGAILAYNIILYAFSLTDELHLLWFF